MIPVKKAGCILLNLETRMVCLVWREKQQDYSFPKGHVEEGESWAQTAVRETDEETGRIADLILDEEPIKFCYVAKMGEAVEAHYFFAYDAGHSEHVYSAELVHQTLWVYPEQVEEKLSRDNLKDFWHSVHPRVEALFNKG